MAQDLQVPDTCMFFVDDSNIWIEHQRFAASGKHTMPKLEDGDHDPRFRIDIGGLVSTLCRGRVQDTSFLYGSRPPPNDTVWNAFQKFRFKTKIYDRSYGKEKEVDGSMTTDMGFEAGELTAAARYGGPLAKLQKAHTVFVAITGDRDMMPAVRRVLSSDIRVELWAWKSGVSTEYLKLQSTESLLTVYPLDDVFDAISFTNFRSTRKVGLHHAKTVVLCEFAGGIHDGVEKLVCDQILRLGRLFYLIPSKTGREMFVEFPRVENIEAMILKTRRLFKGIATVLSWPEFEQQSPGPPTPLGATMNKYAPLQEESESLTDSDDEVDSIDQDQIGLGGQIGQIGQIAWQPTATSPPCGLENPDDCGGWTTVNGDNMGQRHRRAQKHTQRCPNKIRCKKRGQCGFQHSDEEHRLFEANPGQDLTKWKTKMCKYQHCLRGRACGYAHNPAEAWCLRCKCEGHLLSSCRYSV